MTDAFRDVVILTPPGVARGKLPTNTFPIWVTRPIEHNAAVEHPVSAALLDAYPVVRLMPAPTPMENVDGSTLTFVEATICVEQEGVEPIAGLRQTSCPD